MAHGRRAALALLLSLAASPALAQGTSHTYAGGGAVSGFGDHLAALFVVGAEKVGPGGVSIGGEAGLAIAKDGNGGPHPGERVLPPAALAGRRLPLRPRCVRAFHLHRAVPRGLTGGREFRSRLHSLVAAEGRAPLQRSRCRAIRWGDWLPRGRHRDRVSTLTQRITKPGSDPGAALSDADLQTVSAAPLDASAACR